MFLRWPLKIMMKLVWLVVLAAVVYVIVSGVQVVLASRIPPGTKMLSPAATIIVLGSSVEQSPLTADLSNRLQEGLKCFDDHLAPSITVTGAGMVAQLELDGVPRKDVQVVSGSSTAAQIQSAAAIGPGQRVIIVTDAMDAFWVRGTAVHYGLRPQIAPALSSERPFYEQLGTVLSQASAVAVGRVLGFERASWA
jgi:hypothetical protein